MRPVINYAVQTVDKKSIPPVQPACVYPTNEAYLNKLWEKVCLNDLESLEAIHQLLYPLLFNYIYFILNDSTVANSILTEAFINFWYKKNTIDSAQVKNSMIKQVRGEVLARLAHPAHGQDSKFPVKLLTILNSTDFRKRESAFLNDHLLLNEKEIAGIIH